MKKVLISIQPKWCAKISALKKKVEIRKTKPTGSVPFKCYIYCTANKNGAKDLLEIRGTDRKILKANGKVIGEFVCDEITEYEGEFYDDETQESIKKVIHGTDWDGYPELDYSFIAENGEENELCKSSCLTWEELRNYMGAGINTFYGWHISDLVIYDKPKELSEFYVEGDCDCMNCKNCAWFDRGNGHNVEDDCNLAYKGASEHKSYKPLTRPPQSWCYVEEEGLRYDRTVKHFGNTVDDKPSYVADRIRAMVATDEDLCELIHKLGDKGLDISCYYCHGDKGCIDIDGNICCSDATEKACILAWLHGHSDFEK